MGDTTYALLGPIAPGATRASLALKLEAGAAPTPVVFVWLPTFALNEEDLRTRVMRENERATVLEHPHVVRVHGLETHGGRLARVVEYSDGEPLSRVLEAFGGKLPVPLAVRVVMDACSGVHHAHEAGFEDGAPMLHGDIRPDTLMVTFSGATRVSGYGALVLAPREAEGRRKVHAAPEQVLGGREAMSRETDVYLLGLVLHRCLTGRTPWEDDKDFDRAVLTEPLPFLSPAEVPPSLAAVLEKALSKKALGRYPTAHALRTALEQAWPKVATEAQFAAALAVKIPPSDPLRAVRSKIIQEGLAGRAAPPPLPTAATRPPALPPSPSPAVGAPHVPAPVPVLPGPTTPLTPLPSAPVPAAPAGTRPSSGDEGPSRGRLGVRAVAVLGVAFLSALGVAGWRLARPAPPTRQPPPPSAPALPARAAPAPAPPSPAPTAGTPGEDPLGALDVAPLVAATPNTPTSKEPPTLDIQVTPALDIFLDGALLGRGTVVQKASPGRHLLKVSDGRSLVSLRSLTIPPHGTARVRLALATAFITVDAPPGASVQIDGSPVGHAPIRGQVPVLQGAHELVVSLGKAEHRKRFTISPGETVAFNVSGEHP